MRATPTTIVSSSSGGQSGSWLSISAASLRHLMRLIQSGEPVAEVFFLLVRVRPQRQLSGQQADWGVYCMKTALLRLMDTNSSRYRLWLENKRFADSIPAGALVLDAGAGDAPYKNLLTHVVYESADFEKVDKVCAKSTYVCDLK